MRKCWWQKQSEFAQSAMIAVWISTTFPTLFTWSNYSCKFLSINCFRLAAVRALHSSPREGKVVIKKFNSRKSLRPATLEKSSNRVVNMSCSSLPPVCCCAHIFAEFEFCTFHAVTRAMHMMKFNFLLTSRMTSKGGCVRNKHDSRRGLMHGGMLNSVLGKVKVYNFQSSRAHTWLSSFSSSRDFFFYVWFFVRIHILQASASFPRLSLYVETLLFFGGQNVFPRRERVDSTLSQHKTKNCSGIARMSN